MFTKKDLVEGSMAEEKTETPKFEKKEDAKAKSKAILAGMKRKLNKK